MNVNLICVGSIKEKFYQDAIKEYSKRLSRYIKLEIIELKDEKTDKKFSKIQEDNVKNIEGQKILSKIKDNDFVVALAIKGKELDSVELSNKIKDWELESRGNICFIIGASLGLSDEVLKRANYKLSFSKMTYPHQLMRVIFLEQLYRSYRIINNEPYHK